MECTWVKSTLSTSEMVMAYSYKMMVPCTKGAGRMASEKASARRESRRRHISRFTKVNGDMIAGKVRVCWTMSLPMRDMRDLSVEACEKASAGSGTLMAPHMRESS